MLLHAVHSVVDKMEPRQKGGGGQRPPRASAAGLAASVPVEDGLAAEVILAVTAVWQEVTARLAVAVRLAVVVMMAAREAGLKAAVMSAVEEVV